MANIKSAKKEYFRQEKTEFNRFIKSRVEQKLKKFLVLLSQKVRMKLN